ncbi:MAG: hypothetical protein P4L57_00155 [Rhizomicrobium sp.]|nr:hypothetical protein [Rhizomicrobium sp.]
MPSNVRNFLLLSYLSLLLGVAEMIVSTPAIVHLAPMAGGGSLIIAARAIAVGFTALYAIVIGLAGWGHRDWARWLLLVVFAFGLGFDLLALPETFRAGTLADLISWAATALQGPALYLIFTGNAKGWFREALSIS